MSHLTAAVDVLLTPRDGERRVSAVCSTGHPNGNGDQMVVEGIDLTDFLANPIVLWHHDASSLPVGRAENVRVEGGRLLAELIFLDGSINPHAEKCLAAIRAGALRGVSIGADIVESHDEGGIRVITRSRLLELSIVPLPADTGAVVTANRKAKMEASQKPIPRTASGGTAYSSDAERMDRVMQMKMRRAPVEVIDGGRCVQMNAVTRRQALEHLAAYRAKYGVTR